MRSLACLCDKELLRFRFRELPLAMEKTAVPKALRQLYFELHERGLTRFRPHAWLSNEWFSPLSIPGIAIPFYLASPRLAELERTQTGFVEGGTPIELLQILRHEAGHAFLTAYQLRHREDVQSVFGSFHEKYPHRYLPRPHSKKHVRHLNDFYAQSHPDEDFAETFAVWLTPRSGWRRKYRGWGVYRKLLFLDALAKELGHRRPRLTNQKRFDPIENLPQTLSDHYRMRRAALGLEKPSFTPREFSPLFRTSKHTPRGLSAVTFIKSVQGEICREVAKENRFRQYTVKRIAEEMTKCCEAADLRLAVSQRKAKPLFAKFLSRKSKKFIREKRDYLTL